MLRYSVYLEAWSRLTLRLELSYSALSVSLIERYGMCMCDYFDIIHDMASCSVVYCEARLCLLQISCVIATDCFCVL